MSSGFAASEAHRPVTQPSRPPPLQSTGTQPAPQTRIETLCENSKRSSDSNQLLGGHTLPRTKQNSARREGNRRAFEPEQTNGQGLAIRRSWLRVSQGERAWSNTVVVILRGLRRCRAVRPERLKNLSLGAPEKPFAGDTKTKESGRNGLRETGADANSRRL